MLHCVHCTVEEGACKSSQTKSQIVFCLFLEWRDQPTCHLLSLDLVTRLPVALAPCTKLALISEPGGVLALEF